MFDTNEPEEVEYEFEPIAKGTADALEDYAPLYAENYEDFKDNLITWLIREGKTPDEGKGYAEETARATHYRIDHAYRWKWEQTAEATVEFTPDDADELMKVLVRLNKPDSELAKYQKSLKRLFKFANRVKGRDYSWKPDVITGDSGESMSRHYFKKYELGKIYQAAVDLSAFKSYNNQNMTPKERRRLKIHLSQRFEKPKEEVGPEDFKKANSWKYPSIVAVSCDAGLRPIEVGRAKVNWVNLQDGELVIPKEEATKGDKTWEVGLSSRAVSALERWLNERDSLKKYDGRDELWLTKYGNTYTTQSLNDYLPKLIEEAEIEARNRKLTWYSIRRGVATLWANEEGIHNAKEQLRHASIETTERYVHSDSETRAEKADSKW
ncbi:tyrosine-type recombinase/integrase [Halobaculum rarum]|uniref:tyrosine-type recombinase/integrase n=1 Tax=Halobaculum rarum TaxID=3075122 RepID=UPI0032AF857E